MSYWNCDNPSDHEYEGRRDAQYHRSPNYDYREDSYRDGDGCGAAYMDAYRAEQRSMERREEERQEEERAERRREEARQYEREQEEAYEQMCAEETRAQYYAFMEEEYQRSLRVVET